MSASALNMLTRFGFDAIRLRFAIKTAIAAFVSILIAQALGLEHPQWSAMTVWATAQPLREHLLEKGLWRFLGTVSGVIVGIALMLAANIHPVWLVLGLALWVGLCSSIGLLQRGFVAYGTTLAGYSAAMVSLLSTAHPDHVWALGLDRFLTIAVGVVCAMAIGYYTTPKRVSHPIHTQLQALSHHSLQRLLNAMSPPHDPNQPFDIADLLKKMALLDEQLDGHAIGSFRARRRVAQARQLVLAQLNMALYLQQHPHVNTSPDLKAHVQTLLQNVDTNTALAVLQDAGNPHTTSLINALASAHNAFFHAQATDKQAHMPVVLHRNWLGAAHTFVRSFSVIGLAGGLWLLTGWSFMPFMVLGLSVMLSVFANFDNPAWFMRFVILGQVLGATAALACMWLLWPQAQSEWGMVWMMLPFMALCVLVYAYKRTMLASFDFIMVMLILLQPLYPMHTSLPQSLANAVSIVMGPVIAMLAFRWVFPSHPSKRLQHLLSMIRFELRQLCQTPSNATQLLKQRNRLIHSLLRAQRLHDKQTQLDDTFANEILRCLGKVELVVCVQRSLHGDFSESSKRLMRALLQAWQRPQPDLRQTEHMVSVLTQRLPAEHELAVLLAACKPPAANTCH